MKIKRVIPPWNSFLLALLAVPLYGDPVTFVTNTFACDLTIDGQVRGNLKPRSETTTIDLPPGREYLVECENHELPVKLYARENIGSFAGGIPGLGQRAQLPRRFIIEPVAVLPNVVKAVASGKVDAITSAEARSMECKIDETSERKPRLNKSHLLTPKEPLVIPKNSKVEIIPDPPKHCEDTNLIQVRYKGRIGWFRNRAFTFSYQGMIISLYPPSQDLECCWVE